MPRPAQGLLRGQTAGHQMLVRHLPHRARCLAAVPPGRAGRAVAALVRFVGRQHRPPALGEPGQFGTGYRDQRLGVGAIGQVSEHIQAFPYRIAEDLPEDLIHE